MLSMVDTRVSRRDRQKALPGREGRFELDEQQITDPGELISGERVGGGQRWSAPVNCRESALHHMWARGRISDTQWAAAERFRGLWERAAVGPLHSLDPERFGGGGGSGSVSEATLMARQQLAKALTALRAIEKWFLIALHCDGMTVKEVARGYERESLGRVAGRSAERFVAERVREAIDVLVELWKLEAVGKPTKQDAIYKRNGEEIKVRDAIVASGPIDLSGPVHEITVDKSGAAVRQERRPNIDRGTLSVHGAGSASKSAKR